MWHPSAHFTGVLVLSLTFLSPERIVKWLQIALFIYFVLASLDVVLTRYHLWTFEPTTPQVKHYALVTGATSGLGKEMAYLLSEQKYSLVLVARTKPILERMRAEIELVNKPAEVEICACDLSTSEGIQKLINFVKKKNLVIDILINNAGLSLTSDFKDLAPQKISEIMTLNMTAVVQLTHAILPQMIERKIGRILNISSMAASFIMPSAALYGSTKTFVRNWSEAINYELRATGVTVTCFCPGPVNTNFGATANCNNAIYMNIPGTRLHVKDCAKLALEAMFNAKGVDYDTWFAYLNATLMESIIPGRIKAMIGAVTMNTPSKILQVIKR